MAGDACSSDLPSEPSERIVVHDMLRSRGTIHPQLTTHLFSFVKASALVAKESASGVTTFHVVVGNKIRVELSPCMSLTPSLKHITDDCTVLLIQNDSRKTMHLKFDDPKVTLKWHKAVREALAEIIFADAFHYRTPEGGLCVSRIERAIEKASSLVHGANCHMLRAKRVCDIQTQINKFSKRLILKPHLVSREDARNLLELSERDPLFVGDKDIEFIKTLESRLFTQHEIANSDLTARRLKGHDLLSDVAASADQSLSDSYSRDHAHIPLSLLQPIECRDPSPPPKALSDPSSAPGTAVITASPDRRRSVLQQRSPNRTTTEREQPHMKTPPRSVAPGKASVQSSGQVRQTSAVISGSLSARDAVKSGMVAVSEDKENTPPRAVAKQNRVAEHHTLDDEFDARAALLLLADVASTRNVSSEALAEISVPAPPSTTAERVGRPLQSAVDESSGSEVHVSITESGDKLCDILTSLRLEIMSDRNISLPHLPKDIEIDLREHIAIYNAAPEQDIRSVKSDLGIGLEAGHSDKSKAVRALEFPQIKFRLFYSVLFFPFIFCALTCAVDRLSRLPQFRSAVHIFGSTQERCDEFSSLEGAPVSQYLSPTQGPRYLVGPSPSIESTAQLGQRQSRVSKEIENELGRSRSSRSSSSVPSLASKYQRTKSALSDLADHTLDSELKPRKHPMEPLIDTSPSKQQNANAPRQVAQQAFLDTLLGSYE